MVKRLGNEEPKIEIFHMYYVIAFRRMRKAFYRKCQGEMSHYSSRWIFQNHIACVTWHFARLPRATVRWLTRSIISFQPYSLHSYTLLRNHSKCLFLQHCEQSLMTKKFETFQTISASKVNYKILAYMTKKKLMTLRLVGLRPPLLRFRSNQNGIFFKWFSNNGPVMKTVP